MYCYFTVDENNIVTSVTKTTARQEHLLDSCIELEDIIAEIGKKYNPETKEFEDVETVTEEEVFRAQVTSDLDYLKLLMEG